MAGHKTEPPEGYRLSLTFGIGGRREGRSKKVLRGQDGNSLGRTKVCWDLEEERGSADAPSAKKISGEARVGGWTEGRFLQKDKTSCQIGFKRVSFD